MNAQNCVGLFGDVGSILVAIWQMEAVLLVGGDVSSLHFIGIVVVILLDML